MATIGCPVNTSPCPLASMSEATLDCVSEIDLHNLRRLHSCLLKDREGYSSPSETPIGWEPSECWVKPYSYLSYLLGQLLCYN